MATLVLRAVKGSALTNTEMDNNFSNLNTDVGNRVLKSGDTMTGALTLSGDPSVALHAATKQYTDTADNARLQLAGGTMTGKFTTVTSGAGLASILIGVGSVDPSSPVGGDLWNNGGVLKFQVGAATKTIAFTDSALTGNAATASKWATARTLSLTGDVTGSVSVDGSGDPSLSTTATKAAKWTTARSITLGGDATWSGMTSVDGSGNLTPSLTLATVNANTGAFGSSTSVPAITTNAKGLITAVTDTAIRTSSTTQTGIVQLSDSTSTTSSTLAATSTAVKSAYDLASTANGTANSASSTANAALSRGGGTMTGAIILAGAPTVDLNPASKLYVDDRVKIYNYLAIRVL